MKKIFVLLGTVLSVAACANNYDYECAGYIEEEQCPCEEQPVYECQQQPQYYQPAPTYTPQPCGSCQGEVRTKREPVEVIYKKTTYGTVYEPRYFENVSYERQTVNGGYYQAPQQTQTVVRETVSVTEAQPAQAEPTPVPAKKYNGPIVIVPVQN